MLRTLVLDLEYVYEAQGDGDISGVVDYDVLLEGAAQVLEREEFPLLKTEAWRVGEHVMKGFPEVRQVTVTKLWVPVIGTVSEVPVEATLGR